MRTSCASRAVRRSACCCRRAWSDAHSRPTRPDIDTFAKLATPGLILNTAISGHPYDDSELLEGRVAAPGQSCVSQSRPYANLAGGRLIFTNLDNLSGFPEPAAQAPDMWLPYRIVNDGSVKLAAASALTANFPPVFSNARVRLVTRKNTSCNSQSYFVTDGGATENLGLVSALFALRGTLSQMPAGHGAQRHPRAGASRPRPSTTTIATIAASVRPPAAPRSASTPASRRRCSRKSARW